jgi:serine phosphatase RsbU (regulator of sigma subunit)
VANRWNELRFWSRCYLSYAAAALVVTCFIVLNNLVIHNISIREQLTFSIPFVAASDFIIALMLLAIAYWRLYPVMKFIRGTGEAGRIDLFARLIKFPKELFAGVILVSVLFMILFHMTELTQRGRDVPVDWIPLADSVISEFSLALIMGTMLYSVSVKNLRPFYAALMIDELPDYRRTTIVFKIAVTLTVCFVTIVLPLVRFILHVDDRGAYPFHLMILYAGAFTLFGVWIFSAFMREIRQELRLLIQALFQLEHGEKTGLAKPIPIFSNDEMGRLTEAFNLLQKRVVHTYAEIERQLKLACEIQQRLLSKGALSIDGLEIAAACRPCYEVGGDFYSVVPMEGRKVAAAIGDVTGKGMPAALLMSAVMAGLQSAVAKGGGAGEILTRLNRYVYRSTGGRQWVTMGLAVIDYDAPVPRLQYASAGHPAPYRMQGGQAEEWDVSSLPLGFDADIEYTAKEADFRTGDTLILYTDGVIESRNEAGEWIGFEGWKDMLEQEAAGKKLNAQLDRLLDRLGNHAGDDPLDDRTIVMIRWNGHGD